MSCNCFGHLTEGAVAYYQATGKDRLLKSSESFADFMPANSVTARAKKQVILVHENCRDGSDASL